MAVEGVRSGSSESFINTLNTSDLEIRSGETAMPAFAAIADLFRRAFQGDIRALALISGAILVPVIFTVVTLYVIKYFNSLQPPLKKEEEKAPIPPTLKQLHDQIKQEKDPLKLKELRFKAAKLCEEVYENPDKTQLGADADTETYRSIPESTEADAIRYHATEGIKLLYEALIKDGSSEAKL